MKQKTTIFCLSGWAQKSHSLQSIFDDFDDNFEIINFDYSIFDNIDSLFEQLKKLKINPDIVIGWSLGGQLAIRSLLKKIFKTQLLILLGTPFQFVADKNVKPAMAGFVFDQFKNNFIQNPERTLNKFSNLISVSKEGKKLELNNKANFNLEINENSHKNLIFWLEELGKSSFHNLELNSLPKSLIIHGNQDMVVNVKQAELFAEKIANSKLKVFNNCSHTIHIDNLEELKSIIKKEIGIIN